MSQDRLNIKHIAPYLPYGLKVNRNGTDWSYELESCNKDGVITDTSFQHYWEYEVIKPILRPLSDLYKEITHNGKTFIPYRELDWESYDDEIGYIVSAEYGENPRVAINVLDFIDDYYKLLEWHFDVFGLIDKGLAIDKTKIK